MGSCILDAGWSQFATDLQRGSAPARSTDCGASSVETDLASSVEPFEVQDDVESENPNNWGTRKQVPQLAFAKEESNCVETDGSKEKHRATGACERNLVQ